jgi:hypothetical protein
MLRFTLKTFLTYVIQILLVSSFIVPVINNDFTTTSGHEPEQNSQGMLFSDIFPTFEPSQQSLSIIDPTTKNSNSFMSDIDNKLKELKSMSGNSLNGNLAISGNIEDSIIEPSNNNNLESSNSPTSTSSSTKSLYEEDIAGGSWVDSFEDDSGIESINNILLNNKSNSVTIDYRNKYLKNGDFESGTVGQVPDDWTYHIYNTFGAGTSTVQVKQEDSQYFSGSHSLYGYVKCDEVVVGGYRTFLNVTTASFINVSGAKYVYIFMRDISVTHSYSWGWNVLINLHFYDGVNKYVNNGPSNPHPTMLYYDGQSYPTTNLFNFTLTGQDGQTWYVYKREIPKIIDTSNFNMSILWFANDWTSTSGAYCSISSVVDNIFLVTEHTGELTSKPIEIQDNMHWDSLIINKTQSINTNINITILNATNNQQIQGTPIFNEDGEMDISFIDPIKYPFIRLKVVLKGNSTVSPSLHYWGVSWNASNAWRDSLFGGLRVNTENLTSGDGELWLATSPTEWYKYSGNPILKVGTSSSWDKDYVISPIIIYNGSSYLMWYAGRRTNFKIGLATSKDGIIWTKYSSNPVLSLGPSNSWEGGHVKPGPVIYDGKIYKMWYRGMNATSTDWQNGLATSVDGITWIKYPNNPVFKVSESSSAWDNHYAILTDIHFNGVTYKVSNKTK